MYSDKITDAALMLIKRMVVDTPMEDTHPALWESAMAVLTQADNEAEEFSAHMDDLASAHIEHNATITVDENSAPTVKTYVLRPDLKFSSGAKS